MSFIISSTLILALVHNEFDLVLAHGTMLEPASRNSLWRNDSSAPKNYNDYELFCGGIGALTSNNGKCGLCGDSYSLPSPRPHETGGNMATNKIVRNYSPGSTIDVLIDVSANHGGYFEFELCRRDSFDTPETDECFEALTFVQGIKRLLLKDEYAGTGRKSLSLKIPSDMENCSICVLRWSYKAGNNWGNCEDGTSGAGCGAQELYRNCADISIGQEKDSDKEESE